MGYPGVPPSAEWDTLSNPDLGWGTPHQQNGVTLHPRLDGVPLVQDWMGYAPSMTGLGTPHQQSEHLLRGRRSASYIHTGGLSC